MRKTVILYHGSERSFDFFKIGEEYLRKKRAVGAEGLGIYFADEFKFCETYGQYIYEVHVPSENIIDFTDENKVRSIILKMQKDILEITNQDILNYFDYGKIIKNVATGEFSSMLMYQDIIDLLDANFRFHENFEDYLTYEDDCVYEKIKDSFFKHMKDIVKYRDNSFKNPIYICHRNPEKLVFKTVHSV